MKTKQLSVFDFIDGTEQSVKKEDTISTPVRENKKEKAIDIKETKEIQLTTPKIEYVGLELLAMGYTTESLADYLSRDYRMAYAKKVRDDKEINLLMIEIEKEIKDFLKEVFDLPLTVPVKLNTRTSTSLGLFRYGEYSNGNQKALSIEMSKRFLEYSLSYEDIRGVALHEAVHYALFMLGKDHDDGDEYFEYMLRKHNIPSTQSTKVHLNRRYHLYVCDCEKGDNIHIELRKFPKHKSYLCADCHMPLEDSKKVVAYGDFNR